MIAPRFKTGVVTKFIAYLRVSTERQGKSGLCLAAPLSPTRFCPRLASCAAVPFSPASRLFEALRLVSDLIECDGLECGDRCRVGLRLRLAGLPVFFLSWRAHADSGAVIARVDQA